MVLELFTAETLRAQRELFLACGALKNEKATDLAFWAPAD